VVQHPGREAPTEIRQAQRTVGVVDRRAAVAVAEAEMDVHAVANAGGVEDRGEGGMVAEAVRGGAYHLADRHCAVGRPHTAGGLVGHLELAGAEFRHEAVRLGAGGTQGGDQHLGEDTLAAEGVQRIRIAGPVLDPRVDEFMLEGRDQGDPGSGLQGGEGAAQEVARAAFPGAAVEVAQVAEVEMLAGRIVAEFDLHLGGRVGHQD
jgi:hypothetical protein